MAFAVFPTSSEASTTNTFCPSFKVTLYEKCPLESTETGAPLIVTFASESVVPFIHIVESYVSGRFPFEGEDIVRDGGVVSTVIINVVTFELPP